MHYFIGSVPPVKTGFFVVICEDAVLVVLAPVVVDWLCVVFVLTAKENVLNAVTDRITIRTIPIGRIAAVCVFIYLYILLHSIPSKAAICIDYGIEN